jgi:hypothetical protein
MVFRERHPSRHRADDGKTPEAMPDHELPDHELDSLLALISPAGQDSSSELTTRFVCAQGFQLRLPERRIEQLHRLAEARGVSATALVTDWVLERLDRDDPADQADPAPGPDQSVAGIDAEPVAPLSPVEQLNPIGELTPVGPAVAVTPLFRGASGAHAMGISEGREKDREKSRGPRHRAPEPVTSLHTRRRF